MRSPRRTTGRTDDLDFDEYPELGILVLTAHVELQQAMELIGGRGGVGYLLKSRVMDVEEILDAIDRVALGRSVVEPDLVRELFEAQRRSDPLGELTTREREVLALMAEGRSNAGIARRLWLAGGTVESTSRASCPSSTSTRPTTTTGACSPSSHS